MDANLFTEGSIYYYENKTNTKKDYKNENLNHDFIVSRPVYILDAKPNPFDVYTVNVLVVTSSMNRVGIPINIDGYRNGKILPYAIYSIHKEYLTKYMGHVGKELSQEIKEAVGYHLGYLDKVPKYIDEHKEHQQTLLNFINNLTLKEKSVYDLITNKCIFKNVYYVEFDELYKFYKNHFNDINYTRPQDFSRAIKHILELFPDVEYDTSNHQKIFRGMSINGNTHRDEIIDAKKEGTKKNITSYGNTPISDIELNSMSKEQLLNSLSKESRSIYDKLDSVQKISNWKRSASELDFDTPNSIDAMIIKRIITIEINGRRDRIFAFLKNKKDSPYELSSLDQYILWQCSETELRKYINHKYFAKKDGVKKLKRNLENNIKHYFVKCN